MLELAYTFDSTLPPSQKKYIINPMPKHLTIKKLGRTNSGDVPVGNILVVGAIVIPLVITLIIFREEIYLFLIDRWVEFVTTE